MPTVAETQRQAIETARACGYVTARDTVRERRTAARWYRECTDTKRPYIRVTPRLTRAAVTFDMWTVGRPLREDSAALASKVIRLRWILQPPHYREFYTAGIWGAEVSVLKHTAHTLARDLVEIATKDTYLSLWELELEQMMAKRWPEGRGRSE